jgi:hypothetical protein
MSLLLAKYTSVDELVCYLFFTLCQLIKVPQIKYHIYAVLIQDIKELLFQTNVSLSHTLREWNQYADFFTKLGVSSDVDFLTHFSLPEDVHDLLINDAMETFYIRDYLLFLFCLFFFLFSFNKKKKLKKKPL